MFLIGNILISCFYDILSAPSANVICIFVYLIFYSFFLVSPILKFNMNRFGKLNVFILLYTLFVTYFPLPLLFFTLVSFLRNKFFKINTMLEVTLVVSLSLASSYLLSFTISSDKFFFNKPNLLERVGLTFNGYSYRHKLESNRQDELIEFTFKSVEKGCAENLNNNSEKVEKCVDFNLGEVIKSNQLTPHGQDTFWILYSNKLVLEFIKTIKNDKLREEELNKKFHSIIGKYKSFYFNFCERLTLDRLNNLNSDLLAGNIIERFWVAAKERNQEKSISRHYKQLFLRYMGHLRSDIDYNVYSKIFLEEFENFSCEI